LTQSRTEPCKNETPWNAAKNKHEAFKTSTRFPTQSKTHDSVAVWADTLGMLVCCFAGNTCCSRSGCPYTCLPFLPNEVSSSVTNICHLHDKRSHAPAKLAARSSARNVLTQRRAFSCVHVRPFITVRFNCAEIAHLVSLRCYFADNICGVERIHVGNAVQTEPNVFCLVSTTCSKRNTRTAADLPADRRIPDMDNKDRFLGKLAQTAGSVPATVLPPTGYNLLLNIREIEKV